jgi:hypothetical protein
MLILDKNRNIKMSIGLIAIVFYVVIINALNLNLSMRNHFENRIGIGISTTANPSDWAERLNAKWYLDWKTTAIPSSSRPEYWQMIRLSSDGWVPSTEEIKKLLFLYPGHTWIIGNEPDNIWQDNISAEQYARYYHDLYRIIKFTDPGAKIAIGAISQASPIRLKYLDRVLTSYQQEYGKKLKVDWWTLHAYVLREENQSWGADIPPGFVGQNGLIYEIEQHGNLEIFKQNIIEFRKWMKNNGYQSKPLAVTEFGILLPEQFGYSAEFVSDYLSKSVIWLDSAVDSEYGLESDNYHLVQKFAWFSLNDKIYPVANLADFTTDNLTKVGESFRETASSLKQ